MNIQKILDFEEIDMYRYYIPELKLFSIDDIEDAKTIYNHLSKYPSLKIFNYGYEIIGFKYIEDSTS